MYYIWMFHSVPVWPQTAMIIWDFKCVMAQRTGSRIKQDRNQYCYLVASQPAYTCPKSTVETPERCVKSVISLWLHSCILLLTWTIKWRQEKVKKKLCNCYKKKKSSRYHWNSSYHVHLSVMYLD